MLPVLSGQGRVDGEQEEGEIRGSKPDGGTERESILGERNCRERQRDEGEGDKVKAVTSRPSSPLVHHFNDRCS